MTRKRERRVRVALNYLRRKHWITGGVICNGTGGVLWLAGMYRGGWLARRGYR